VSHLNDDELERYARHIVLPQVGGLGQRRLKAASILVVGAGGVASGALPALAGAGIGRLTIVDDDTVGRSNLQRQWLFRDDQLGQSKARLAAIFLEGINPAVNASPIVARIDASNAEDLLAGHDLVLDGSDNFATRLIVSDAATALKIPLISAAAAQLQGQIGLFRGWEDGQPCYRCFVGDAFDADDCDTCAELGVLGALTGTVGNFAALLAIRAIVGIGPDGGGTLHLFDGLTLTWRQIRIAADPACKACGATSS